MNTRRFVGAGLAKGLFMLWLLSLASLVPSVAADGRVLVPPLQARLTDLTGTLTAEQQAGLEQTLRAFETKKARRLPC